MNRSLSLSLRSRLTIWYSAVLLLVLCLGGAVGAWQQGRIGIRRIDRQLENDLSTMANVFTDEYREGADVRRAAREVKQTVVTVGRAVAILDQNGGELAASWNGLTLPGPARAGDRGPAWTAETASGAWRVHIRSQQLGAQTVALLAATPLSDVFRERHEAIEALWVGIPLAWLVAVAGGLWLASVGLRPITEMAERAARLPVAGSDDLGQSNRRDELGQLARAFNDLLSRLRHSLHSQRQFMADASHEFRTPVSVIRCIADVMLGLEHRDEPEYRQALAATREQAIRLGRMVEDMLVLARADAGGYSLRPVALYLNELAADCQRTLSGLARERRVALKNDFAEDVPYMGDEDLLRRMLLNLVQNAVQHTPVDGMVLISATHTTASITIRITDQGRGIPDEERARIFERFVQLDAARRNAGVGLGLPIARWIAEAHGGRLELESSDSCGSVFSVQLPVPAKSAGP